MDALGYLVRFRILSGQAHDRQGVPGLLDGLEFGAFVGDRAFGADWLPEDPDGRGAVRQDRRELRGGDSPRRRRGRRVMTVNGP